MELYFSILFALMFGTVLMVLIVEVVSITKRVRRKQADMRLNDESLGFFDYLNALVLEVGCFDSAIELCKAERLWRSAKDPESKIAALDLVEGVASIILSDAAHTIDSESFTEVTAAYKTRKNKLIWAMDNYLRLCKKNEFAIDRRLKNLAPKNVKEIDEAKTGLVVHYARVVRGYPKPWEHEQQ